MKQTLSKRTHLFALIRSNVFTIIFKNLNLSISKRLTRNFLYINVSRWYTDVLLDVVLKSGMAILTHCKFNWTQQLHPFYIHVQFPKDFLERQTQQFLHGMIILRIAPQILGTGRPALVDFYAKIHAEIDLDRLMQKWCFSQFWTLIYELHAGN